MVDTGIMYINKIRREIFNFISEKATSTNNKPIFFKSSYGLNKTKLDVYIAPCVHELYKIHMCNENCNLIHNTSHVPFNSQTHLAIIPSRTEEPQLVVMNDTNTNHEA